MAKLATKKDVEQWANIEKYDSLYYERIKKMDKKDGFTTGFW